MIKKGVTHTGDYLGYLRDMRDSELQLTEIYDQIDKVRELDYDTSEFSDSFMLEYEMSKLIRLIKNTLKEYDPGEADKYLFTVMSNVVSHPNMMDAFDSDMAELYMIKDASQLENL